MWETNMDSRNNPFSAAAHDRADSDQSTQRQLQTTWREVGNLVSGDSPASGLLGNRLVYCFIDLIKGYKIKF